MDKIISFPHMANYSVPVGFLFKKVFPHCVIQPPPTTTKRTLEIGSRHSPDFVCVPFKYNIGNYIEALEAGANVLIQAGGGCRFGYYAEVQEQILRDLGYKFDFIPLYNLHPVRLYRICKDLDSNLTLPRFFYYILLAFRMIKKMDKIDSFVRENIGFEVQKGEFDRVYMSFLADLPKTNTFRDLDKICNDYDKKIKDIATNKPKNCLKVGLVGELYTLMEPFSNFFIEKELAKYNIEIKRFTNITYLLFDKEKKSGKLMHRAGKYLKYHIGADGTDSVVHAKELAEIGYDGIIHVKPFGCTPEVNAMPMLQNIAKDYSIPVLYFSFDSQTSETGVKTRLEAFNDMLVMRKNFAETGKKTVYGSVNLGKTE